MMKCIGIVCEGPTDFIILKAVINRITGEKNRYLLLQPENSVDGKCGSGWKGVWKWCHDNALSRRKLMRDVEPALDFLVVHLDGDVSRKEKPSHCCCENTHCDQKGRVNPLECDIIPERRAACPIMLPCPDHEPSITGYISHLKGLVTAWLDYPDDTCIAIPCDSIEAWIVAAFDQAAAIELCEDPWLHIISRGKEYHDIRIHGKKKHRDTFDKLAPTVCQNWPKVTELCQSALDFERSILELI